MPPDDAGRRAAFAACGILCTAGVLLLPIAARSAFRPVDSPARFSPKFEIAHTLVRPPRVDLERVRDPFVSPAPARQVQPLPPGVRLRAIVSGGSPRALIEEGGRAKVVAVGDALAGSIVSVIGSGAVVLQDGRSLPLSKDVP